MPTLGPHLLGRIAPPDQRHVELYPFTAAAIPKTVEVTLNRPLVESFDQGQTPQCVAYSTSKVMAFFNHYDFDAPWLYARCKEIDGMPGVDGTNARAACDVLRTKGHLRRISGKPIKTGPDRRHGIKSNTWATSVDAIRAVFARKTPQPVLIGANWYEAWFNPETKDGEKWLQPIAHAGAVAGGHEWGVWGCSDRRQACGLSNTWGLPWDGGRLVWVPYSVVDELLHDGGDACVIQDLATR